MTIPNITKANEVTAIYPQSLINQRKICQLICLRMKKQMITDLDKQANMKNIRKIEKVTEK